MTTEQLHKSEYEYFEQYIQAIYTKYPPNRLNHFEHNVNVWARKQKYIY
jgi:hypothetical protein